MGSNQIYEIDKIIHMRVKYEEVQFAIYWKGYNEYTWEPISNITGRTRNPAVQQFRTEYKKIYEKQMEILGERLKKAAVRKAKRRKAEAKKNSARGRGTASTQRIGRIKKNTTQGATTSMRQGAPNQSSSTAISRQVQATTPPIPMQQRLAAPASGQSPLAPPVQAPPTTVVATALRGHVTALRSRTHPVPVHTLSSDDEEEEEDQEEENQQEMDAESIKGPNAVVNHEEQQEEEEDMEQEDDQEQSIYIEDAESGDYAESHDEWNGLEEDRIEEPQEIGRFDVQSDDGEPDFEHMERLKLEIRRIHTTQLKHWCRRDKRKFAKDHHTHCEAVSSFLCGVNDLERQELRQIYSKEEVDQYQEYFSRCGLCRPLRKYEKRLDLVPIDVPVIIRDKFIKILKKVPHWNLERINAFQRKFFLRPVQFNRMWISQEMRQPVVDYEGRDPYTPGEDCENTDALVPVFSKGQLKKKLYTFLGEQRNVCCNKLKNWCEQNGTTEEVMEEYRMRWLDQETFQLKYVEQYTELEISDYRDFLDFCDVCRHAGEEERCRVPKIIADRFYEVLKKIPYWNPLRSEAFRRKYNLSPLQFDCMKMLKERAHEEINYSGFIGRDPYQWGEDCEKIKPLLGFLEEEEWSMDLPKPSDRSTVILEYLRRTPPILGQPLLREDSVSVASSSSFSPPGPVQDPLASVWQPGFMPGTSAAPVQSAEEFLEPRVRTAKISPVFDGLVPWAPALSNPGEAQWSSTDPVQTGTAPASLPPNRFKLELGIGPIEVITVNDDKPMQEVVGNVKAKPELIEPATVPTALAPRTPVAAASVQTATPSASQPLTRRAPVLHASLPQARNVPVPIPSVSPPSLRASPEIASSEAEPPAKRPRLEDAPYDLTGRLPPAFFNEPRSVYPSSFPRDFRTWTNDQVVEWAEQNVSNFPECTEFIGDKGITGELLTDIAMNPGLEFDDVRLTDYFHLKRAAKKLYAEFWGFL